MFAVKSIFTIFRVKFGFQNSNRDWVKKLIKFSNSATQETSTLILSSIFSITSIFAHIKSEMQRFGSKSKLDEKCDEISTISDRNNFYFDSWPDTFSVYCLSLTISKLRPKKLLEFSNNLIFWPAPLRILYFITSYSTWNSKDNSSPTLEPTSGNIFPTPHKKYNFYSIHLPRLFAYKKNVSYVL